MGSTRSHEPGTFGVLASLKSPEILVPALGE